MFLFKYIYLNTLLFQSHTPFNNLIKIQQNCNKPANIFEEETKEVKPK